MEEYTLAYNKIRNIITTRTASEWSYIVEQTKKIYQQDISDTLPVFLQPSDFEKNSSIFDAGIVFTGWYAFKKTPILIIHSFEELEKVLGKDESNTLREISHFIN